jgi:hypothetical protein
MPRLFNCIDHEGGASPFVTKSLLRTASTVKKTLHASKSTSSQSSTSIFDDFDDDESESDGGRADTIQSQTPSQTTIQKLLETTSNMPSMPTPALKWDGRASNPHSYILTPKYSLIKDSEYGAVDPHFGPDYNFLGAEGVPRPRVKQPRRDPAEKRTGKRAKTRKQV